MPRYIDADAFRNTIMCQPKNMSVNYVLELVSKAPTADVRENVKAHWIKEEYFGGIFKCSNCGKYVDFRGLKGTQDHTNFCPNCGAEMDERRTDDDRA